VTGTGPGRTPSRTASRSQRQRDERRWERRLEAQRWAQWEPEYHRRIQAAMLELEYDDDFDGDVESTD
jgi:hypothetical protein